MNMLPIPLIGAQQTYGHDSAAPSPAARWAALEGRAIPRVSRERRSVPSRSAARERVVLRRAAPKDDAALARLAELDSARRPAGELLVAEVDGQIAAALAIDGGHAIADPFRPTAELVELLRLRARRPSRLRRPHRHSRPLRVAA